MRRLKKDLEKMLETRIQMSLQGRIVTDVPLEAFYHLQNFFRGPLPLELDLTLLKPLKK